MEKEEFNLISGKILNASISVHKNLGPGLLESVYEYCLIEELNDLGLKIESQVIIPILYKQKVLDKVFRIDLLIEKEIIIEIKAVEVILPIHFAQLSSYLKLADKRLGLLINFNVVLLKDGFKRIVNQF